MCIVLKVYIILQSTFYMSAQTYMRILLKYVLYMELMEHYTHVYTHALLKCSIQYEYLHTRPPPYKPRRRV